MSDFGSYFVGGRSLAVSGQPVTRTAFSSAAALDRDPNGRYHIEQAYVQYFVPQVRQHRLPILFVHGGGLTGACWETTPDGRPGWLHFFVRAGFTCHVLDNAERGRAGFCPFPGVWPGAPIHRSMEEAWTLYRLGTRQGERFTPFPGTQFPTEFATEFMARHVPRWIGNEDVLRRNLNAALEVIGPCLVVAHSQGGGLALGTCGKVAGCILLEPHGVPDEVPDWLADAPMLALFGDFLDPFWSAQAERASEVFARWRDQGRRTEVLPLPTRGMRGTSHMPMMDRNSDEVARLALDWLAEHVIDL